MSNSVNSQCKIEIGELKKSEEGEQADRPISELRITIQKHPIPFTLLTMLNSAV